MKETTSPQDLPRTVLAVLAIAALVFSTGWLLLPFVAATLWATTLAITTWPLLLWLERRFGGRRAPAAVLLVLALVALLVAPVWMGISAIADNFDQVAQALRRVAKEGLPPPPDWVAGVPLVGQRLAAAWQSIAGDADSLMARVLPHVGDLSRWVAAKVGGLGAVVLQFLLTVIIAAILFFTGEKAARGVLLFLRRLAGDQGEAIGVLAARAVRAVALGIVVTAVLQTVLAGAGLTLVRMPHAGLLTAVAFVLCIAQVGPLLVLAPAVIWLYADGSAVRGTVLLVFSVLAVTLDNLVRPLLIKRGADLPLLLILAGVFGGLAGLGVVGLFVGPVLLAVAWTLLSTWVAQGKEPTA